MLTKFTELFSLETTFLVVVFVLSLLVRVWGIGYSHYYGDEIKTLYLDKTVPAMTFLLDQRKGPVQFIASWFMEKITGGYDEGWIRLPFVLASTFSVLVFYFVSKKIFGRTAALYSTVVYAFSGLNVAFGRTAQYQSFLMLFGLMAIFFALLAKEKNSWKYLLGASFFWALSVYSHYDGVFFVVPIVFLYCNTKKRAILFTKFFILPAILMLLPFYLPYVVRGYFGVNTLNYVSRRVSGTGYLPNSSLYTILVYNPLYLFFLLSFPGLFSFMFKEVSKLRVIQIWLLTSFIFYEVLISNPGTHINNYLLPLILLSGFVVSNLNKKLLYPTVIPLAIYIVITFLVYVPSLNTGYPWKESKILGIKVSRVSKKYQLFLYGFPYNRGWDHIADYFRERGGARGVFTNDNDSLAQYYLLGIAYTPPGPNFLPQYYIHVLHNQEIGNPKESFYDKNSINYRLEAEFYADGQLASQVYRLIK